MHLKRNEFDPFLKRIITGDEKCIVYNNVVRKRSWSKRYEPPQTTLKAELHQEMIMLSVWWNWEVVVFFELLPRNQTINSDVYCRQLNKLNAAVIENLPEFVNCKGAIFHHDNATLHASLVTCQKLLRLGWEVMLHPPYRPDLPPSDYYLFRSLQNSLNGKIFNDNEAVKSHLIQLFVDRDQKFYERGVVKLPDRWQNLIEQSGKYIID